MNGEINKVLARPESKARVLAAGAEALPLRVADYAARVQDEKKLFAPLMKSLGLKEHGWAPLPHPLLVRKPSRIIIQLAFHQLDTAASSPPIRLALRLVLVDTLVKQSVEITTLSDRTCPYNGKHSMKSIGCSVPSTATDAVR
ncbi:hypothetical protein G6F35_012930 [Rhizopus arrhizus]|nr:hypothetical protein G6F35_012930 [Rhizopus arrhizus]